MDEIKLIIGLGNPGKTYKATRHNLGFRVVDALADKNNSNWKNWSRLAKLAAVNIGRRVTLAKPQRFMNNSGHVVHALLEYFGIKPQEMLVVLDDFSIPVEKLRLRQKGSAGGHNGLVSIIENINTSVFPRLRLGIGPVPDNVDHPDFVLSEFSSSEKDKANSMIKDAVSIVEAILHEGIEKTASKMR